MSRTPVVIDFKITAVVESDGTVIENEIVPGIPYGHFADEEYKNVTIVTKAGGFGGDDAIFQVLKFLNKRAG